MSFGSELALLGGTDGVDLDVIQQSAMFDSASSSHLSISAAAGTRTDTKIAGFCWVRFPNNPADGVNYIWADSNGPFDYFRRNTSGTLTLDMNGQPSHSTAVLRDPSSWYPITWLWLGSSDGNLVKVWVADELIIDNNPGTSNGSRIFQPSYGHYIGRGSSTYSDFLLAEFYLADDASADVDASLDYNTFIEQNANGVWVPKSNISFDIGTATRGGHYQFGNSSDFGEATDGVNATANNMGTDHQFGDTPGRVYPTLSSIDHVSTTFPATLVEGGRRANSYSNDRLIGLTQPVIESGCYWEATVRVATSSNMVGLWVASTTPLGAASTSSPHTDSASCVIREATNTVYNEGSGSSFTPGTITTDDVMMFAYKNGQFFYGLNGTWENSGDPVAETGELFTIADSSEKIIIPVLGRSGGAAPSYEIHVEEADFNYTMPSGYEPIASFNHPEANITKPSDYFDSAVYTGNGTAIGSGGNEISDLNFQPDMVWIKNRSSSTEHMLYDSVRGAEIDMNPDSSSAEATNSEGLSTFDSDGFTVGSNGSVNTNTHNFVAWCWKEDSVPGFDMVSYTGNGANRTISHGLGVVPELIIAKKRDAAGSWRTYDKANGATTFMLLDTSSGPTSSSTVWNNTAPTSSVFSLGTNSDVNQSSNDFIAYLFASIPGYSHIGQFVGNGSSIGPFIHCGFRPAFVMIKRIDTSGNWHTHDTKRNPINVASTILFPDATNGDTAGGTYDIDILSNGFKLRTSYTGMNGASADYLFVAFAENPTYGSNIFPANAR